MREMLSLTSIHKHYGQYQAVKDLNLTIEEGEFVSLLGPSGCGKTTTLRMIAGLETPSSGEIQIAGKKVYAEGQNLFIPPEKRGLGMVFQSYAIWPHKTVAQNVTFPLEVQKVKSSERQKRLEEVLALVKLEGLDQRKPHELSGGQQQRVALARALIMRPQVLLLDEPLSNLDAKLREEMRLELKSLPKKLGMTIVYVTHDQAEALVLSDRLAVMNKGVLEQWGDPAQIYLTPATSFVAQFMGPTTQFMAQVVRQEDDLVTLKVGKSIVQSTISSSSTLRSEMHCIIRPQDVELGQGNLQAKILERLYFGDHVEYELLWEGMTLRARAPASSILPIQKMTSFGLQKVHLF